MRLLQHVVCYTLAITASVSLSASSTLTVQSDQQVLIELERGWNDAFYRQVANFVANLLADEFIVAYD